MSNVNDESEYGSIETAQEEEETTYYDELIASESNIELQQQHIDTVSKHIWESTIVPYIRANCNILSDLDPDRDFSKFHKWILENSELPRQLELESLENEKNIYLIELGKISGLDGENIQ